MDLYFSMLEISPYTEVPEVLIVVKSITHQEGIGHLKAYVWNETDHCESKESKCQK